MHKQRVSAPTRRKMKLLLLNGNVRCLFVLKWKYVTSLNNFAAFLSRELHNMKTSGKEGILKTKIISFWILYVVE